MNIIEARGIHKSYNSLKVLKGIDLEIVKGEVVSIVGASGAGKSTLLHLLGTLDNADQGEIKINNIQVQNLRSKELSSFRNKNIGFIFQFHQLLPEFNAIENVCIPGLISNKPKRQLIKEGKELLDFLGLSDRLNHKPGELSGGEQQRVAVARALINKPAVIMADEPSGNLDSASSHELHHLFFKLRAELNQTFVIVTHNEDLANMADRKLLMKDGRIHEEQRINQIFSGEAPSSIH